MLCKTPSKCLARFSKGLRMFTSSAKAERGEDYQSKPREKSNKSRYEGEFMERQPKQKTRSPRKPHEMRSRQDEGKRKRVLNEAVTPLVGFTKNLIDVSADRGGNIFHGDAKELLARIPQVPVSARTVTSLEKAHFMEGGLQQHQVAELEESLLMDSVGKDFQPGTFVEIRRNDLSVFGIVLRIETILSRLHALTLTHSGEIWPHLLTDVTYMIPHFVPQDLVRRAGGEYQAMNNNETLARLEMVEKVRVFARQHEQQYNSIGAQFRDLYNHVHHLDPVRWGDITSEDAARVFDVRRPPPVLYLLAVHSHLMADSLHFVADPTNHRSSQTFAVRPKAHVEIIIKVDEWTREAHPVFKEFVSKAKSVREQILQLSALNPDGPPTLEEVELPVWSETDMVFIDYLKNSLRTLRSIQKDPYDISLPTIVKSIGLARNQTVDSGVVSQILRDIGVLSPWDDIVMRNPELRIELTPTESSKEQHALRELIEFNKDYPSTPISLELKEKLVSLHLQGNTELHASDPWADIRRDFGRQPVYVIDDATAQELDDGLSIEPVAGEPGCYWIHVHIADPTTFLPHGHVVDVRAEALATTVYSNHRTWPMLPEELTTLSSLGAQGQDKPQTVLTFSIKMSEKGEFLDSQIAPSVVRNIQILSYDQVNHVLGYKNSSGYYPFGAPPVPDYAPIPEEYLSDVRTLSGIGKAFRQHQARTGKSFGYYLAKATVSFPSPIPFKWSPDKPLAWTGYPEMEYVVAGDLGEAGSSRDMVSVFMILAGRAASRYCKEKGLPGIRRVNLTPPCDPEQLAEVLALRNSAGNVPPPEVIKRNIFLYPSEISLQPNEHWALGIPKEEGYSRVTSPLRRYSDILMHSQIKHDFLPPSKRTTHGPLFPAEWLFPAATRLAWREKLIQKASASYQRHWTAIYLARHLARERKLHGKDYNPFPQLTGTTLAPTEVDTLTMEGQVVINVDELGIRGIIKGLSKKKEIPVGTVLPIKFSNITLGLTPKVDFVLA